MNRGVRINQIIIGGVLLCFSICTSVLKAEVLQKKYIESAVKITGDDNNLLVTAADKLFELECISDGIVTITNADKHMANGVVTVFCNDLKEIILQTSLGCNEAASFHSVNKCKYLISWRLMGGNDAMKWTVRQKAVEGLSERSAIRIESGMQEVSHGDNMDKWFVFTADKKGRVKISTVGLTGENTTLFVYKECADQMIRSSNCAANTLQSEAIIDVEAGQSYFIKWSSAFTNGRYGWNLFYL